jgi:16S rRNA (guanine966-N2)-methyltransferase
MPSVRIIAGSLRGRRIRAPRGQATRPTSDRVRQAIFDILGPPPETARVLDLYAGAGGLGLEALSRGAAQAVFVEARAGACACLADNARALGLDDRAQVIRGDARAALRRLGGRPGFHWVFADPPYAGDETGKLLDALAALVASGDPHALFAPGGLLILEHSRRHDPGDGRAALRRIDQRRWGDTAVSFYAVPSRERSE